MSQLYTGDINLGGYFHLHVAAPIDDRFVVDKFDSLITNYFDEGVSYYTGMTVYVADEKQLYVLTATANELDDISMDEDRDSLKSFWKPVVSNSSSGNVVVSSASKLTDGSIDSLSVGSIVYVNDTENTDANGLYILIGEDSTNASNWVRNTKEVSILETGDALRNYISADNTILSSMYYTSQGLNTYDDEGVTGEEYITLSNGGASYIKLFNGTNGNWIEMSITDESLGFSLSDVKVKSTDGTISSYSNGTALSNGTMVCFGKDIDFTGFKETRPDGNSYTFGNDGSTYEDVDIYSEKDIVNVTVYDGDKSAKVLTDVDKDDLEDKISSVNDRIDNIYTTLLIDPDGDGSDVPSTLQQVIINMNNAIAKLDEIDITYATNDDIDNMDDSDYNENAIIQVKNLKYFREKLLSGFYSVENNTPVVEINGEKKELATKEYVDSILTWQDEIS